MVEIVERGVLDRIDNRYWVSGWRERLILWIARRYVASLGITLKRVSPPHHQDCVSVSEKDAFFQTKNELHPKGVSK